MTKDDSPLILVVDDNSENLRLLCGILEEHNYQTVMAKSGKDAITFLEKESADLILLDIMMPDESGINICKLLKRSINLKNIPIIFVTARAESEDVVNGFEAGAVDYITKPFNPSELLARVKTHIELKLAREEIKTLRGIVPLCAGCKNIRLPDGTWQVLEEYIQQNTEAELSHGLCPDCIRKLYPDFADKILASENPEDAT
ncbi:MAG: response regulator [Chitinispirillaceae bacterium]|nr:response regulator [Chitinispirillaceae bacterium]